MSNEVVEGSLCLVWRLLWGAGSHWCSFVTGEIRPLPSSWVSPLAALTKESILLVARYLFTRQMFVKLLLWPSLCWVLGMERGIGNATFWSMSPPSLASDIVSLLPLLSSTTYSLPSSWRESDPAAHVLDIVQRLSDVYRIKPKLLTMA